MPGRDGTGPMGKGPMGGRGFGNCAGRGATAGVQATPGQGFGRGFGQGGGGRGMGRMFQAGATQGGRRFGFDASNRDSDFTMENQALKRQNEALQSELDVIKKRLDAMETRTADSR